MTAFRTMLSEPLAEIIHQMEGFDPLHPNESKLSVKINDDNELLQLKESYNNVIDDLIVSNNKLTNAQDQLSHANKKTRRSEPHFRARSRQENLFAFSNYA